MSWAEEFREKHARAFHPDVLNRIDFTVSIQENIERKKQELARVEKAERENRWNFIIIRETRMIVEALEEELKK